MRKKIIYFCAMAFSIVVMTALIINVLNKSDTYFQRNNIPQSKDCLLDATNYVFEDRKIDYNLAGDWNFFYNDWIVTDNVQREADGVINVPHRWTNIEIDGKKLPPNGFASYEMKIRGIPIGSELRINVAKYFGACRGFVNGVLVVQRGFPSKTDKSVNDVNFNTYEVLDKYIVKDSNDISVVIEVAQNDFGGLYKHPYIGSSNQVAISYGFSYFETFSLLAIGASLALILISFMRNLGAYQKKVSVAEPLFVLSMFLKFMFGMDGRKFQLKYGIGYNSSIFFAMLFISTIMVGATLFYMLHKKKIIKISRVEAIVLSAYTFVVTVLGYAFKGYDIVVILNLLYLLPLLYCIQKIAINPKAEIVKVIIYTAIILSIMYVTVGEVFDLNGVIRFGSETIAAYCIFIIIFIISIGDFIEINKITRSEMMLLAKESQWNQTKEQFLRAQIKPHFIFNSMSAIKSLYHRDMQVGDLAVDKFSKHLRSNIDSENTNLIPFEEEIGNIMNFFELENLRFDNKMTLLFDIGFKDFEVPILSLQPFIENSIKYSGMQSDPEIYIQVKSRKVLDKIQIQIIDNGKGFDMEKSDPNSKGINNVRQRFSILQNAKVEIASKVGKGVVVTITIPPQQ